jgi:tRNA(Ile)-lysidine synthase
VIAATVDHGLRPEAASEAAMVAQVCARLGVPHETIAVAVAAGNLQTQAREARYDALCRSFGTRGAEVFATAHHADDQAETLLMRLNRGSGLAGLAGVRARRVIVGESPLGEYLLVRPLLHWRRAELAQIVSAAGIEPVSDPSNEDPAFDRARMRQALAALPWLDPLAVARSAELLQQAEDTVENAVAAVGHRAVFRDGAVVWYHWGHARLVEVEVVGSILEELGADVRRSEVAQMVDQLRTERHATLGGVMARRAMHQKDPLTQVDAWRFEREPPRRI